MVGLDVSLKFRQTLRRRLDDKLPLARILKFALPPVKRLDRADDLNASGEARASDAAR